MAERESILDFTLKSRYNNSWVINGCVGVGKSSAIQAIKQLVPTLNKGFPPPILTFSEDVHKWRDYKGANLLEEMYRGDQFVAERDGNHWLRRFQLKAIIDVMDQDSKIRAQLPTTLCIQERDITSIRLGFLPLRRSTLGKTDYSLLSDLTEFGERLNYLNCKRSVFLYAKPSVMYSRMISRGREEEKNISFADYEIMVRAMDPVRARAQHRLDTTDLTPEEVGRKILELIHSE